MTPHRRNPLRLIVNRETQLRILWLVGGAIFSCAVMTFFIIAVEPHLLWDFVLVLAVGAFVALWTSRQIAGPLYRIEKDLENILSGAVEDQPIRLREGDQLQRLAGLINQLMQRMEKP